MGKQQTGRKRALVDLPWEVPWKWPFSRDQQGEGERVLMQAVSRCAAAVWGIPGFTQHSLHFYRVQAEFFGAFLRQTIAVLFLNLHFLPLEKPRHPSFHSCDPTLGSPAQAMHLSDTVAQEKYIIQRNLQNT